MGIDLIRSARLSRVVASVHAWTDQGQAGVTLSWTPGGGRMGPGGNVRVASDVVGRVGPFSVVAHLDWDAAVAPYIFGSNFGLVTPGTTLIFLGVDLDAVGQVTNWPRVQPQFPGLPDGEPMTMRVTIRDNAAAFVDGGALAGFFWDPTSFLTNLYGFLAASAGGHDPMLDLIYAAVHKDWV